jgi:Tfp pilus assembly protein PilW
MTPVYRCQRGVTVAELLVTAAVIGVIMAGLFSLLLSGQHSFRSGVNRAEAQQNARLVLNRMVQDIRTAGFDPKNTQSFAAVTALPSGTGFVLRNDWSGDGVIQTAGTTTVDGVEHGEQITYTFSSGTLTRQETGLDASAVTVTTSINSVTVQYLDASDTAVSTPSGADASLIRTVVLDITTNSDTITSGTVNRVAVNSQNRVRIRNR